MDSEIGESMGPYNSGEISNDTGNFECNICFELAQDPIVTLCGHLYCWPCLYRWLHIHSHCRECPVCKALIQEEKLVPLYGRGKTSSDPRSRSVPGAEIPNRPAGQRPETAQAPGANYFRQDGMGIMGGFMPTENARIRNSTFSATFGGLMQSLNLHVHGFHDATVYGATTGFPYMFSSSFHGGHVHGFHQHSNGGRQINSLLKMLFLSVGLVVVFALIT
ncbi:uncharacterized protein LOC132294020 [Cornus florida]|uniref:uncharacterized protein LOC132294020 n=1 Tax=Cornus florida TaxID=4283 RepID=UPI00289743DD|nr:uncharacterized protein LOC132294020 [Cornus florida]XP_059647714.1 uncharacterized protein LOC132294020 [Cornus florida]